jgi:hypothetical protein
MEIIRTATANIKKNRALSLFSKLQKLSTCRNPRYLDATAIANGESISGCIRMSEERGTDLAELHSRMQG